MPWCSTRRLSRPARRCSDAIVGWGAEVKDKAVVADYTVVGEGSVIGAGCELRHGVRVAPGIELGSRAVTFSAPT